jgi:signal transduction histidine kinase
VAWERVSTADAELVVEDSLSFEADDGLLANCLENLFRNAVEHGSTSPPSASPHEDSVEHGGSAVTVRVGAHDDGFFVEDDGVGIPAEDRERVFDAGFSTGEQAGHTGLGLLIVRAVCEAHDWTVAVTESDAGGARFEISGVRTVEA